MKPTQDRVIIKRDAAETKTAGGLFVPSSGAEEPITGTVIAIGKGRTNVKGVFIPTTLKEGDRVLFNKYAGQEITHSGEKYLVMREEEIFAVET